MAKRPTPTSAGQERLPCGGPTFREYRHASESPLGHGAIETGTVARCSHMGPLLRGPTSALPSASHRRLEGRAEVDGPCGESVATAPRTAPRVLGSTRPRYSDVAHQHPGVVLDDYAACLGCHWLFERGYYRLDRVFQYPVDLARRHETSNGTFRVGDDRLMPTARATPSPSPVETSPIPRPTGPIPPLRIASPYAAGRPRASRRDGPFRDCAAEAQGRCRPSIRSDCFRRDYTAHREGDRVLAASRDGASINAAAKASGVNYRTAQRIVEAAAGHGQRQLAAVG
jgi:hypothetical protein